MVRLLVVKGCEIIGTRINIEEGKVVGLEDSKVGTTRLIDNLMECGNNIVEEVEPIDLAVC